MKLDRLTKALTITLQIIISLVLFIIVLPFFVSWRVSISFLYLTKKEKEEPKNADQEREKQEAKEGEKGKEEEEESKHPPPPPPPPPPSPLPKDAHERALAHYNPVWESFRDLAINKPLVTHWSRVAATIVLLTQTMLSLALLEKSLVYHIPWFITHLSNTHYKTSKEKVWCNDLLLHMSGLVITCAPFVGLIGVGVGILYYSVKVWKYGRFKKGAVRRTGGRGYDNLEEKKRNESEGEHGVKEAIMGVVGHVMHPHLPHVYRHSQPHAEHESEYRQPECSSYEHSGHSGDILFEQPGGGPYGYYDVIQSLPPVTIRPPERTAWYDKNPYTLAGIASIWTGTKEKTKTGYDGRDTRRQNFADEIEMADRARKK